MRQIDADALKEHLDYVCVGGGKWGDAEKAFITAFKDFVDGEITIQLELPSAEQWIPCSERLPEEDGQYLITVKYVHVDGYEDIYAEHGDWADGKWDMFCFGHCGKVESILAWMPLPKPWKGEKNDS